MFGHCDDTVPIVQVLAPILHHIAQEYYEAKLFEKDLNHLCLSIFFKFLGEAFLPIFDEPSEMISELKEEFKNDVDELDIKNKEEEKRNDVTHNETESNGEEEEEIPNQVLPSTSKSPAEEGELEDAMKFPVQKLELDDVSKVPVKEVVLDDSKRSSLDPPGRRDNPGSI